MLNFNCATWSFFLEHNFRWWAKLTLIFLIISFRLELQAWFRVSVVTMVLITFRFIIPLTCCRCWLITSSWSLSTKFVMIIINILTPSWISIEFMMGNTILALDDLCGYRPLWCLPSNTNLFVFCVIPWVPCYPAFDLNYLGVLPSL